MERIVSSLLTALALLLFAFAPARAADQKWTDILAKAKGQTVYWNAWAGDEQTNAFIAWVGDEVSKRYGVSVHQVPLRDTAEAVTRVLAEKTAGRDHDGSVDLIWINGPNFLAMKQQHLLYGPFSQRLPNISLVDTVHKPSNLIDFTVPVDGYESPWRVAQVVYVYDSARTKDLPRSVPAMLDWARAHPGRLTHPSVRNFLGATFLKQALYELTSDPKLLQQSASDATFTAATAPLWAWYDALRPLLWRQGQQFPENGPAMRQLLADGEIDIMISFNPSEAAVDAASGLLPVSARVFVPQKGSIGNTSFVAIPYNAAHKEAAEVVANFLLDPATQAHAQDLRVLGNFTVLDLAKLAPIDMKRFADLPQSPATPSNAELGALLLEPHPSWMTRITAEWEQRYTK